MPKIFFDTEFTGFRKDTEIISLGMIAEDNSEFYAEFFFNEAKLNDWLRGNVIPYLNNKKEKRDRIRERLNKFLEPYSKIEMWSDCLHFDWILFLEIFNFQLPSNILYIPFDLCTLFKMKNIDPDISRAAFSGLTNLHNHNALDDAKIIKACYERLTNENF